MSEKTLIAVFTPSGDFLLVHGVRLERHTGENYGLNYIVLDRADGSRYTIFSEGSGYVAPEVSTQFAELRHTVAKLG